MNLRWHLSISLAKIGVWLLRLSGWYSGYWNHWRELFSYVEQKGIHILPVHYYQPIPDTRNLPDELWTRLRLPLGFSLGIDPALAWLRQLNKTYAHEYASFPREHVDRHTYYLDNGAFRSGDAEILYAIVRQLKPRRIVEIGSGYSTLLTSTAIRANRNESPNYQCEFTAVEPFPAAFMCPPPLEVTRVERKAVQRTSLELFSSLGAGDILFIDSTHVAKIGSDVIHEYLTILPGLAPGVVVHIHDIFIPKEYPRYWIEKNRFFWNEQYLLEAFLNFNREFEVIMPVHALWQMHPKIFRELVPSFETGPQEPSSFWIRRRSFD